MQNRASSWAVLAAAFVGGMWTWRTVHFMSYHGDRDKGAEGQSGDPNVVYKIPVGDAATRGGPHPKVTIVAFSDFECPFCARAADTLATIQKKYGSDLLLAFKHKPLESHPHAAIAAIAAEAAREQGKFWEMHDQLFAHQRELSVDGLKRHAQELGLDEKRFAAGLEADRSKARVKADQDEADRFGVRATPAFFINGRHVRGAVSAERFMTIIDEELRKADAQLAAGVPRDQLYATLTREGRTAVTPPVGLAGQPR